MIIWAILFVIGIIVLGLIGGQKNKGARRFGIPGLTFVAGLINFRWKNLSFLLLIPVLAMGYGENSFLMGIFHNDTLVRLAYAVILSIPFAFLGIKRFLIALPLIIGAFQIRGGSLASFGGFDILIEDIVRYGVIGILLAMFIFRKRTH